MTDPVLHIAGVTKARKTQVVLQDITLSAKAGQRIALLGHNGAGKSTLMKAILGLIPCDTGQISIDGHRPGTQAARAATAYLPEAVSFHRALTGAEQLTMFARLAGGAAGQVGPLLERVGLQDAKNQRIGTYSKGMRQRLGLAQVLLGAPKLALLDEPTSGLDPVSRYELYTIIDELAAQGTAVVIASHTLTEVEARTDRIAILRKGCLVADDTLARLTAQAKLPTCIRIKARGDAAEQIATQTGGTRVNGCSVEVLTSQETKMQDLRRITEMGDAVSDVEMQPPGLEELYRYFSKGDSGC